MLFGVFESADAALSVPSKSTGKPTRAFVDTALALNEIPQRFIHFLEFGRVPQYPRPLAPRALIDPVAICRAKNHSGKRFCLPHRRIPAQV